MKKILAALIVAAFATTTFAAEPVAGTKTVKTVKTTKTTRTAKVKKAHKAKHMKHMKHAKKSDSAAK